MGRWVGRSKGYAIQLSLAKQATQQRHEGGANEGDTAAGHELLHALALWDEDFSGVRSDGEQAGQQRYEDHANDGDARAGHQLFHALAFY